jgi:hypothetical protein
MLKGLTSQLMPTVTAIPRHCSATPVQRAEVDLQQHRHNHQPDQDGDRDIDLGHGHAAERLERGRKQPPEHDTRDDAECDPDGQITLKGAERRRRAAPAELCAQHVR